MNKWILHSNVHILIHKKKQTIFAQLIRPLGSPQCVGCVAKTACRHFAAVAVVAAAGPAAAVCESAGSKGPPGTSQIW